MMYNAYTWTIRMGGSDSNTGVIMARQLLRDTLADMFGGYTERLVKGGWRDPETDVLYHEVVFEITSDDVWDRSDDYDARSGDNYKTLAELCERCKELTGEKCIYLNTTFGFTNFI